MAVIQDHMKSLKWPEKSLGYAGNMFIHTQITKHKK